MSTCKIASAQVANYTATRRHRVRHGRGQQGWGASGWCARGRRGRSHGLMECHRCAAFALETSIGGYHKWGECMHEDIPRERRRGRASFSIDAVSDDCQSMSRKHSCKQIPLTHPIQTRRTYCITKRTSVNHSKQAGSVHFFWMPPPSSHCRNPSVRQEQLRPSTKRRHQNIKSTYVSRNLLNGSTENADV